MKRKVAKKYKFNIENHKVTIEPTEPQPPPTQIPELSQAKFTIQDSVLTVFPSNMNSLPVVQVEESKSSMGSLPVIQVEESQTNEPEQQTIIYEMPDLSSPQEYSENTSTKFGVITLPGIISPRPDQNSGEINILLVCNTCGAKFDNTRDYRYVCMRVFMHHGL